MSAVLSIPAPAARPQPPHGSAVPAFFCHHGLMAPGIRLFRVIRFPAKAIWVSAAFLLPMVLLPMVLLARSLWATSTDNVEFSANQLQGTPYARKVIQLLEAAQHRRRADLAATGEKVDAAFKAVADDDQRLGQSFATHETFRKLAQLQTQLAAQPARGTSAETFTAHTAFIGLTLELLADVADGSNLTLDSGLNTLYLMNAAVASQPALIEQLGRLRAVGNAVLRSGTKRPTQHDTLTSALAFFEVYTNGLKKSLPRALDAEPSIRAQIDPRDTFETNAAFVTALRAQVMAESPPG